MMHKLLLFVLFIGFFASPAVAQVINPDPQGFKQRLRAQYLENDTAQAIINLYSRRQGGGAGWIIGAALAAVRVATGSTASTNTGSQYVQRDNSSDAGVAFLIATPIAAYGVGKMLHYSNGNLERDLTAYAAGQPLRKSLRRKLKPRFFKEPIVKYKTVPVKPAK